MEIINLGNTTTNNWLIGYEGKRILVDTGYPEAWPSFTRRLAKAGLTPGDIDWLFLTHAHDDHAGFVNELLAVSDCTAVASASALKGLRRGQNGPGGGAPDADALAQCLWMVQQGHGAHRFPALAPGYEDRFLWVDDATRPDIEARLGLAILPTPGHTGDSLSLLTPEGDLFCGDAAQNGRPTHGKTTIWIGDLATYIHSWEAILALDPQPRRIYPGHGRPFPTEELVASLPALREKSLHTMPRRKRK